MWDCLDKTNDWLSPLDKINNQSMQYEQQYKKAVLEYQMQIEQEYIQQQLYNARICKTVDRLNYYNQVDRLNYYNQIDCSPIISITEIEPITCIYKSNPITKYNIQLELWGKNPDYKII